MYRLSSSLSKMICHYANKKEEVEFVRYGLEIILGGLIKLGFLFLFSVIFDVKLIMVIVVLTFALFRSVTGGHHFSTYPRCLIAGTAVMLLLSLLTKKLEFYFTFELLLLISLFSILFGLLMTYYYAPSNHFYKKSNDHQRKALRYLAFTFILLWGMLIFYLIKISFSYVLTIASVLGFLYQISSLHPITYRSVNKIEQILDWRVKKSEKKA